MRRKVLVVRKYGRPLSIAVLAFLMARAGAQSPSIPPAATVPKMFDVASIRPSPDRTGQPGWIGVRGTGDMLEVRSVSLRSLVRYAYAGGSAELKMVSSGGGWIDSQQWDIVAKVDDPSFVGLMSGERADRMVPMLQALLEERFHLKLHTELRPTPVYALVQAKGGAKVKEVPAPPELKGDQIEAMRKFRQENLNRPFPGTVMCSGGGCTASAVMISDVISQIGICSHADRPVVDQTGLKGYYDLSFPSPHLDDDRAMAEVEEDLGVKFEPRKMDLTTYVIDSAQRPSEN